MAWFEERKKGWFFTDRLNGKRLSVGPFDTQADAIAWFEARSKVLEEQYRLAKEKYYGMA